MDPIVPFGAFLWLQSNGVKRSFCGDFGVPWFNDARVFERIAFPKVLLYHLYLYSILHTSVKKSVCFLPKHQTVIFGGVSKQKVFPKGKKNVLVFFSAAGAISITICQLKKSTLKVASPRSQPLQSLHSLAENFRCVQKTQVL